MSSKSHIPVVEVSPEIRRMTGEPGPTYRQLWDAVVSGRIEAERDARGRSWVVRRENLPAILAAFGLTTASVAA